MSDKPPFDPSKPFQPAGAKPAFDPSKAFEPVDAESGPNRESDANDSLLSADPATLTPMEKQQQAALQMGAGPQYSKKQIDQGKSALLEGLAAMTAAGTLMAPTAAAAPAVASRIASTGGLFELPAEAAPAAEAAKSVLGESASHLGKHALQHVAPWLKGGGAVGAAGYAVEKGLGAIERRLHHFLK